MKLEITRSTVCDGKPVEVGEVVETSSRLLVSIGKAVVVDDDTPVGKPKKKNRRQNRMISTDDLEQRDAG